MEDNPSDKDNVKVVLRVRPLNEREKGTLLIITFNSANL